jgi:hypothetical protein
MLRCVAGITKDIGWVFGFLLGLILDAALWVKACSTRASTRAPRSRIIFNDGSGVIAKYKGHRKGKKIETDKGTFNVIDIRAANQYKPLPHER